MGKLRKVMGKVRKGKWNGIYRKRRSKVQGGGGSDDRILTLQTEGQTDRHELLYSSYTTFEKNLP